MIKEKILYLNHGYSQCGVYQFGKDQAKALEFQKYDIVYKEIGNLEEFNSCEKTKAVIINYHPCTMPYITRELLLSIPQTKFILMVHDQFIDFGREFFYVFPDPTKKVMEPNHFAIDRVVPSYYPNNGSSTENNIGSFGFGFAEKDYVNLVGLIYNEIPEASIRLHIPASTFGDPTGHGAGMVAEACRRSYPKANIYVNHRYLYEDELIDWLGNNQLNIFTYRHDRPSSGVASVTDWAIAARRPFAVNNSPMFRHITTLYPELIIPNNTLRSIISKGNGAALELCKKWDKKNLRKKFREIINEAVCASW